MRMLSWAEIELNAILSNINAIRQKIGNRKIFAVVKANAYGHGAVSVANSIEKFVDMFAVATLDEAIELRQSGIKVPILNLFCIFPNQAEAVLKYNITQMVCQIDVAKTLSNESTKMDKIANVHVKVDTGMTRLGVHFSEATEFVKKISELPNIQIDGIYTHFANADGEDKSYTQLQLSRFQNVLDNLIQLDINIPTKHASNSAAILDFPSAYFDAVRPGIILYGIYPSLYVSHDVALKPALTLKSRITFLKTVSPGTPIGYGLTYSIPNETIIATIPIGYADGFRRELSNSGEVLVHGKRVPVIGRVCMDGIMCDVGDIPELKVGDEVVLIGKQGEQSITVDEVAEKCGTISYEILCGIGNRIKRVYV